MTTTELITPPCAPSSLDAHLGASAPPTFDAASFHTLRPRLFGIACRVLGSAADADDVVQDTWIRWQGTDRSQIRDATGFLVTATTRLAMTVGNPLARAVRPPSGCSPSSPSTPAPIPRSARSAARRSSSRCERSRRS
jgi:DNA-directed RNA polymerase specialized sigma24 family protein